MVLCLLYFIACKTKEKEPVINNTEQLISFVKSACEMIEEKGEESFPKFRKRGGKWFHDNLYIFVWGLDGQRYVYPPNPDGEGENMLDLKDIIGKPIGKMIMEAVSGESGDGWVFYEWPKPGEDTPTWKSTYLKKVTSPDEKEFLVGSGIYNMKTEKQFIVKVVNDAIELLQKQGLTALSEIGSPKSKFIFLNSYVYIKDIHGNELLNPAFPEIVGTNVADLQDSNGEYFVRRELEILKHQDSYWNEYMWPKLGEKTPSRINVFVKKTVVSNDTLVVGAGYFPDSIKSKSRVDERIDKVVTTINEAVLKLNTEGEKVFTEFREKDSKWFQENFYIFIYNTEGNRIVYPPNLKKEGANALDVADVDGKHHVQMFINKALSDTGVGWIHYKWPKPGEEIPVWKSTFVKKSQAPSGEIYVVCAGLYDVECTKEFIKETVNNAAVLLKKDGKAAFDIFRSKSSEFIFLNTYVYVKDMKGNELVNPFFPELEGTNIYGLQDVNGKYFVRDELEILKTREDCWMDYMWPKPGETEPSMKLVYVKKVKVGEDTLVVGAGYFPKYE